MFLKLRNKDSNLIEDSFQCYDNDFIYFVFHKYEPFVGFTILDSKALKRRKGFEHLLFDKKTVLKLINYFDGKNKTGYFECVCTSEILRIVYEDNYFYLDVFDNYAHRLKSGIKTSTSFHKSDVQKLLSILDDMLSLLEIY